MVIQLRRELICSYTIRNNNFLYNRVVFKKKNIYISYIGKTIAMAIGYVK